MLVAALVAGVLAFRIDPQVVTRVATSATGLWVPAPLSGEIVRVDGTSGDVTARVPVGAEGSELELAERDNGVIVVNRSEGSVSLVDPALQLLDVSMPVSAYTGPAEQTGINQ